MIKKTTIVCLLMIILVAAANAQYYYKDIVSNRQAAAERLALREQKIRVIEVHSFEGDKTPSEGFFCEKKISKDYRQVETYTKSYTTGKSLLLGFYDDKNQLLQTTDSSDLTVATSVYAYDKDANITSVTAYSHSADEDFNTSHTEEHQYKYNLQKQPVQLLLIKNKKDSTLIDFIIDEHGNVTDEIEPGTKGHHYYYYYDAKNRLTDIVKYNVVLRKLLPDFSFEYNSSNQVTQMIAVEEGVNRNYYTWKYVYNDGLRIIEKCYSKENVLLGYFEYEYN